MALSATNLLNVRASLGFAGGVFRSTESKSRENYLGLGLGFIHRTKLVGVSSYGITPTWYHDWDQPETGDQDTAGLEIHMGFLKDNLRLGLGTRDVENFENQWFFTIGVMDLPGATYWLTR